MDGNAKEDIGLCWCALPAVMKYHSLGGLNEKNVLFHSPGGWESEIKVVAELVPPRCCEGESVPCLLVDSGGLLAIFGAPWLVDAKL